MMVGGTVSDNIIIFSFFRHILLEVMFNLTVVVF